MCNDWRVGDGYIRGVGSRMSCSCTLDTLTGAFHMPFSCCQAQIQIFRYPFCCKVRAPFEVPTSDGLEKSRDLGVAKGLVSKANAICFGLHCLCEKCNLHGEVGMGVGTYRGRR